MAYTAPQIGVILLKADRTMYKIGQIAYENMFAEDNEALDYERDVIFIYKKAVEFADDFFVGTEKLDKVVERLATKISAYDYGELNPIYADAATVNIPSVVAGAALNDLTDVTIANLLDNQFLRYNAATGQWINVGPGSAVRSSQAFIATAGQSVFTTSAPFDTGLFDLYVNGVKLNSLSYTTMGEYQITLNDPCSAGDIVDVVIYDPNTGINPTANTLNDLTDVNIGPLVNKQALYYNSASGLWENGLVFVPYTGATAAVDLGEYEIRAGQFTLDTSPTGTATVGTTRWNDAIGSSETTLKGGSVILKNGVDLVARVVNKVTPNTTLTKASYAAVRISGAQGQRLAVAYAQANNDANSADTIGLVTETIATNQEGFIMTMGSLEGINTTGSLQGETWADGDVLYLSPTVPGRITNVKPTGATGHIVVVGYVEYAHANNGKIYVKTMNGWELDELHNVNINPLTLANGDVLKYNSTTQLWENGVDAGGITGTGVAGQVPYFTGATSLGGSNNLFWDNANGRLGIGTNVPTQALNVVGRIDITGSSTVAGSGISMGYLTGTYAWIQSWASRPIALNPSGNNVTIGVSGGADNGQRLQVYGDTLLRGSGNTSATTALTVLNSDSNGLLTLDNFGVLNFGNLQTGGLRYRFASNLISYTNGVTAQSLTITTGPLTFSGSVIGVKAAVSGATYHNILVGGDWALNFSADTSSINAKTSFSPTSSNARYSMILADATINQQGGANGITRGLYVNPTLTAAADWRSVEWSNNSGWGLYGEGTANNLLNGNLGLGVTPTQRLHVAGNTLVTGAITGNSTISSVGQSTDIGGFSYTNGFGHTTTTAVNVSLNFAGGATNSTYIRVNDTNGFSSQTSATGTYLSISSERNPGLAEIGSTGIINFINLTTLGTSRLTGSSTVTYNGININYRINRTGTGVMRGLYYNPIVENLGGSVHNAIETTTGNVLFGSNFFWDNANGRLGIGTNAPNRKMQLVVSPSGTSDDGINIFNGTNRFIFTRTGSSYTYCGVPANAGMIYSETNISILSDGGNITLHNSGGERLRLDTSGNIGIGITPTVRLHVSGDTILRGSGATSATTALTVQNSSSTELFSVRNDGSVNIPIINFPSNGVIKFTNGNYRFQEFYDGATASNSFLVAHPTVGVFNFGFGVTTASSVAGTSLFNFIISRTGVFLRDTLSTSTNPNASSVLELSSTTRGFLPPRMTTTQKNAIATPAAGLVVYDTTLNKLCVYTTAWETITSA